MIPKTIHFCWLSNDPFPKSIQNCLDTWSPRLSGYTIKKWDFSVFPKDKSEWVNEAFDAKKYAFAADYIRNYALYTEGGIYLDSDVELIKSFDSLLHLPYFMGFENGSGCIDAGVLGSEPGSPIFKKMLDYYEGRHFVNEDGSLNTTSLPRVMNEVLTQSYQIKPIWMPAQFDYDKKIISVLPYEYFSPINIETKKLEQTKQTIAIHHFAASWATGWPKYRRSIKKLIGPTLTGWGIKAKRALVGRSSK